MILALILIPLIGPHRTKTKKIEERMEAYSLLNHKNKKPQIKTKKKGDAQKTQLKEPTEIIKNPKMRKIRLEEIKKIKTTKLITEKLYWDALSGEIVCEIV